tara:strand:+ start:750 stop:1268 length:519 start_codon:yes stop_codon:yes gene_type:complete
MNKKLNIALTIVSVLFLGVSGTLLAQYIGNKRKGNDNPILFMGGLENSISLQKQVNVFTQHLKNQKVTVHSHNELDKLKNNIKMQPSSKVVLFSAGGKFANEIAELVNNPNQIYVIEPYTCGRQITKRIPIINIYGGNSCKTGNNVAGIFRKDYGGSSHIDSLYEIGKRLKK